MVLEIEGDGAANGTLGIPERGHRRDWRITKSELARAAGLPRDAVSKASRSTSLVTQARLRELSEIINRVIPCAGSELAAYAWYRSQSLPSLGDATAEELVRQGQSEKVHTYLARITAGGFA